MRTAIVGLGEIGRHHLAAIRAAEATSLAAVCDLDLGLAERSAAGEVPHYDDVGRMLEAERPQALCVCLPHSLHREVGLRAIEAGCHVVVEKPVALDLAECDELEAAAIAAGVTVGVSHNQLFYEPHRRLAELLSGGELGALRTLYARLWIGGRYGGWRERPEIVGGGLLMDAGVHRIYMLRALGGPVTAVSATMDSPRAEEAFAVCLEFEGGATGIAHGSYHGPSGVFDDRLDALCADGVAAVAGCEAFFEGDLRDVPALRVRRAGGWADDPVTDSWDASVARSVGATLAALAADEPPPVGVGQARETIALIEAAYRSAETGERVEVGAR